MFQFVDFILVEEVLRNRFYWIVGGKVNCLVINGEFMLLHLYIFIWIGEKLEEILDIKSFNNSSNNNFELFSKPKVGCWRLESVLTQLFGHNTKSLVQFANIAAITFPVDWSFSIVFSRTPLSVETAFGSDLRSKILYKQASRSRKQENDQFSFSQQVLTCSVRLDRKVYRTMSLIKMEIIHL